MLICYYILHHISIESVPMNFNNTKKKKSNIQCKFSIIVFIYKRITQFIDLGWLHQIILAKIVILILLIHDFLISILYHFSIIF